MGTWNVGKGGKMAPLGRPEEPWRGHWGTWGQPWEPRSSKEDPLGHPRDPWETMRAPGVGHRVPREAWSVVKERQRGAKGCQRRTRQAQGGPRDAKMAGQGHPSGAKRRNTTPRCRHTSWMAIQGRTATSARGERRGRNATMTHFSTDDTSVKCECK